MNICRLPLVSTFILCKLGYLDNVVCFIINIVWGIFNGIVIGSTIAALPPKLEPQEQEIGGFIITTFSIVYFLVMLQ